MATVQEMLAAIEARNQRPINSVMQNIVAGYQQAQAQKLDRVMKLMAIDQARRQMEEQEKMRKELAAQEENAVKQGVQIASAKPAPVLPSQKMTVEYSQDEKGNISKKWKPQKEDGVTGAKNLDEILARKVESGEMALEDAVALKAQASPASVQFVGMQNGKPVFLNPKTKELSTGTMPGEGPLVSTTQSEGQANAKLYADRSDQAHKKINEIANTISLSSTASGLQGVAPNVMKSKEIQMYEQSKRNFVNAVLRRESGAVISPSEFENADKQYFPQFGDSPEVIEQKKQNRETAIEGLKNAAGIPKESASKTESIKPKTVIQNGYTYTLNEKTGQYE